MKFFFNLILGLVALAAVLFFAKNAIAKVLIETGVEKITGMPLKMQGIDVNVAGQFVRIDDMKIFNPSGFPKETMVHIPEIYVAYDMAALLKGKVHLPELRFAMEEFSVVRNQKGELNLDRLRALGEQPGASKTTAPEKPPVKTEIQIDSFILKVGRVFFKDYSTGSPSIKTFEINLAETFTDITDPNALVRLIVSKALMSTTIAAITGFDLGALQSSVTGLVGSSAKLAGNLAGKSLDEIAAQTSGLNDLTHAGAAVSRVEETAKDAATALKSKASSLTGGLTNKLKSLS